MYIYIYVYYIHRMCTCERTKVLTKKPIDVPKGSQNTPEQRSAALLNFLDVSEMTCSTYTNCKATILSVSFSCLSMLFQILSPFVPVLSWSRPQKDLRSQPGSDPILYFRIILQRQQFEFDRISSGLGWLGTTCSV